MQANQTHNLDSNKDQKHLEVVPVDPPPEEFRVQRMAHLPTEGARKTRYSLPQYLKSPSPVGYRTRIPLNEEEGQYALRLLSLERPTRFLKPDPVREEELFEECSLGILLSRQSTNFRGHRQSTLGPKTSKKVTQLLNQLSGNRVPVLENASYSHLLFARPYRTPFTMLLTLLGHPRWTSLFSVLWRIIQKRFLHKDDIPTIGYLQDLHIGILADGMERATAIASQGQRRAQIHMAPFCGIHAENNQDTIRKIEELGGLSSKDRRKGWRLALVSQVGRAIDEERVEIPQNIMRKIAANLLAFRSERIQPGVNQDPKAPEAYQKRQPMDVPDKLTLMAGRAAYNGFAHWTSLPREQAKNLMILDRIDVLTPNGKERLRNLRSELNGITDRVVADIPLWADLPTGRAFSKNAARSKKAFALAGQRIYIGGLAQGEIEKEGIQWDLAIRAFGAAACRSALFVEIMGCVNLPGDCDLLCGICMMAGPVNLNDAGKEFWGYRDLLTENYGDRDPTSLLVWTLKAKTILDPIGNEEQLMNATRKGALVDLRAGPHEVILVEKEEKLRPFRDDNGKTNRERAFADQENFVTSPEEDNIPGNPGEPWPPDQRAETLWPVEG